MADIELVIKIPERIHYGIEKGITVNGSQASQILIDAVKNGTPLPKGHGRLIDADKLLNSFELSDFNGDEYDCIDTACQIVNSMPVTIESYKEQEE